jgi:hypothetical protein
VAARSISPTVTVAAGKWWLSAATALPIRSIVVIVGLERRVTRAGKESIDHAPDSHDDIANAVAGCAVALRRPFL